MHWTRTVAAVGVATVLAGCATTEPASVLGTGPRMIELYRGTAVEPSPAERGAAGAAPSVETRGAPQAPEGTVPEGPKAAVVQATCRWGWFRWRCEAPAATPPAACACVDAPGYARTAANEIELLFPRLPNPDVYIYVPAHLATELRIPVPGYTTAVPLYDRVEYALPGEGGAAHGPSQAPPGASAEETRADACPEEARPGASPGEVRSDASLEEAPSCASPDAGWSDGRPEQARLVASSEEAPRGANPEETQPDASPGDARPEANPEDAPHGTNAEVAPAEEAP